MSHDGAPAYGLWFLVAVNVAVFVLFAFSFVRPRDARGWQSLGAFAAFAVALFTEMYGFPLTIYLLSGWLQTRYPGLDLASHDAGHLWFSLLGLKGSPHFNVVHLASDVLILAGFAIVASAWRVLHEAQRAGRLATTGLYGRLRHPQYAGFIVIMFGFLVQWPTILTLAMFPVLVWMYVRLARAEEAQVRQQFGAAYDRYAAVTPAWLPRLGKQHATTS